MNITLRHAKTKEDLEFARVAHHRAYKDTVIRQFGKWDESQQNKWFYKDWGDLNFDIILCEGQPCGYTSVRRESDYYKAWELVVLPEFQGRGIGTKLLKDVLAKAKDEKLPVRLSVLLENNARSLYARMGFKEYEKSETHYLMEWKP